MKQISAILLVLCVALGLSACCCCIDAQSFQKDSGALLNETPETTQPSEIETLASEETKPEQFLNNVMGVWIFDDTVIRYDENNIFYQILIIEENQCSTGYCPGEIDRPGIYQDFTQLAEDIWEFDLFYEAGTYMDEYLPEVYVRMTLAPAGGDKMNVMFDQGEYLALTYGGETIEATYQTACNMVPYIPETEPQPTGSSVLTITPSRETIYETDQYRIVREDWSGRNSDDQVLVLQYYDYVELKEYSTVARKINESLLPSGDYFLSLEEVNEYSAYASVDFPYQNIYRSGVTYFTDKYLCVTTTMDWYMGGVHDSGNSAMVFDLTTGEQVSLRAFANGDPKAFEAQLKWIAWEQISPLNPWEDSYEKLSAYTLDTFSFSISNGQILLYFPEYEFFPGAHGPVTIETGLFVKE